MAVIAFGMFAACVILLGAGSFSSSVRYLQDCDEDIGRYGWNFSHAVKLFFSTLVASYVVVTIFVVVISLGWAWIDYGFSIDGSGWIVFRWIVGDGRGLAGLLILSHFAYLTYKVMRVFLHGRSFSRRRT